MSTVVFEVEESFSLGSFQVPAFQVTRSDFLGCAFHGNYGPAWLQCMQMFAGQLESCRIDGKISVLPSPFAFQLPHDMSFIAYAKSIGMPDELIDETIAHTSVRPDTIGRLKQSECAALSLYHAWSQGAEAVVFSSAGLGSAGLLPLYREAIRRLGDCAAVDVFSPQSRAPVSDHTLRIDVTINGE